MQAALAGILVRSSTQNTNTEARGSVLSHQLEFKDSLTDRQDNLRRSVYPSRTLHFKWKIETINTVAFPNYANSVGKHIAVPEFSI